MWLPVPVCVCAVFFVCLLPAHWLRARANAQTMPLHSARSVCGVRHTHTHCACNVRACVRSLFHGINFRISRDARRSQTEGHTHAARASTDTLCAHPGNHLSVAVCVCVYMRAPGPASRTLRTRTHSRGLGFGFGVWQLERRRRTRAAQTGSIVIPNLPCFC